MFANAMIKIFMTIFRFNPTYLIYYQPFTRKMLYQAVKLYSLLFLVGLVRRPYIKGQILSQQEAEKQVQEEEVSIMLAKIDIKLSSYPQNYFVIISAYCSAENDEELVDQQRALFELNNMINRKLDINQHYYQDIKFLFIGDEDIYNIVQQNTLIEFYPKQRQRKSEPLIYIMSREEGQEKLLTTTTFKADLKSVLNIISKHKARKFAQSMQF